LIKRVSAERQLDEAPLPHTRIWEYLPCLETLTRLEQVVDPVEDCTYYLVEMRQDPVRRYVTVLLEQLLGTI